MKHLLEKILKSQKAIFSININDMIDIRAVADCAKILSIPMIFNVSLNAIKFAGLYQIAGLFKIEKERTSLPFFIQLDHAKKIDLINECIKLGFDAIMVDGSELTFEKNIEFVKKVRMLSENSDVTIEAQLGEIISTYNNNYLYSYTEPDEAKQFIYNSKTDCLSISFGNEHNYYLHDRIYKLDLNRLRKIHELIEQTPLVMHGADTISNEDIVKCVESGITKINIGPCFRKVYLDNLLNIDVNSNLNDSRQILSHIRGELTSYLVEKLQKFSNILYFF